MRKGFARIARLMREIDPDVRAYAQGDAKYRVRRLAWAGRPTVAFGLSRVRRFQPVRGRTFAAQALSKSEQYTLLESASVSVPRWARLTADHQPDLSRFGPYVVVKPDLGQRGADVRIVRRDRVRFSGRPGPLDAARNEQVVQEFVYTGPIPEVYRIQTLFGEPLWAFRVTGKPDQRRLESRYGFGGGGIRITSGASGCRWAELDDPEAIEFARRAAGAFPEIPTLGFDIARDCETGELSVLEANPSGWSWTLYSESGRSIERDNGVRIGRRYDAERRAAQLFVREGRKRAE